MDVQAAFARSDASENTTLLDCVVAEDQAYGLMGVIQYLEVDVVQPLDSEEPATCWLGFVTTDGMVYSAGAEGTACER